ncbi:MAG: mandelate racemase/muconate lactonizing enzyme family protein [Acidobacteriota bacterium]|nr:mandelate racemase/muconate lactonizing enzyme family protein [Acidobacteriota bacterium]
MKQNLSRRNFLGASAGFAAAGLSAVAKPIAAAAQSVGVKPADLPDLTIKEVKVYVTDISKIHKLNSPETGELLSIVTNSGIEGNYTIGDRNATPGWLDWAKQALVGKNIMDVLPTLTSTSGMKGPGGFDGAPTRRGGGFVAPGFGAVAASPGVHSAFEGAALQGSGLSTRGGGSWPNYYTAAADVCLWDILGKAVNRPIYKILSGGTPTKDRLMAYASSQHLPTVEDYVPDVLKAKAQGFLAYKIHPGGGQHATGPAIPSYIGHMEEIREVRKAVGDEFVLMHDPVQRYNRQEAMTVGRLLDELNYAWFEDPIRTTDKEGLIQLCAALNLPIHVGEFIYSIADFAEYIKHDALDVVRLIADNVGGISGAMRVGLLADAHGLECTPHNWGNVPDMALHFHVELALPNSWWFEMPFPAEYADRPEYKDKFRINEEGYVLAPTAPGLGYPIDRDALDKMTKRIDR